MRSLLFAMLLFSVSLVSMAQREVPLNLQMMENKPYQFGFTIGAVFSNLQLQHSGALTPRGTILLGNVNNYGTGINVAVLATLRLTRWLDFRVSPGVVMTNTPIQFVEYSGDRTTLLISPEVKVPATYIEIPMVLKYRSTRYQNWAPYLLAGVDLRNNASPYDGSLVALNKLDWALQFGVGSDFYLPYFRFGVELKICIGMNNAMRNQRPDLDPAQLIYTRAIDKAFSRMFILAFNFE